MSRNWLRACSLIVGGANVSSQDLGGLRVVFAITQWTMHSTNQAHFRVYNLSPSTVAIFSAKEFTSVQFYAGYEGNTGLIFSGDIIQSNSGHETAIDSYVDIFARDGDFGYKTSRVTKILAAGYTPQDKLQAALDAFAPYGISFGFTNVDLSQPVYPRGLPMIGMSRNVVREIALSKQALWSIQNGKICIVNPNMPINTTTVTMNSSTGLIGWPKQTINGIIVTSLLNPALQPHVNITLDPSQIIEAEKDINIFTGPSSFYNTTLDLQGVAAGTYTIFKIERSGDTRGQEWYDTSTCVGVVTDSGGPGFVPLTPANEGYYVGN